MSGTLYGLGVGPGDPELITLKALRLLRAAPVVAYPAPEEGPSLARTIVAGLLPCGQIEIPMRMKLSAARFPDDAVYDRAAAAIGLHLAAGRDVAVLCEGDPFFYGSFLHLFGRMADRFAVEVVPGVSSLTACAAELRSPLAARDDVLVVLPATLPAAVLVERLGLADAAAIIKIGRHFAKVAGALATAGLSGQARYIERASMTAQRVLPLAAVDDETVPYFSMILVHRRGEAWS